MLFKHNKLALFLIPNSAAQSTVLFSQLDTFYSSIPDANNTDTGTVLSEQELPIDVLNSLAKAMRIAYSSTHPNGHRTPTTATIFAPTSPWRGPRPAQRCCLPQVPKVLVISAHLLNCSHKEPNMRCSLLHYC